jgi:hypothetical protein
MRDISQDETCVQEQLKLKPDDIKAQMLLHYIRRVRELEAEIERQKQCS